MKIFNNEVSMFILLVLAGFTMMAFQNCSSSMILISSGRPAKANSHINDMIKDAETEIKETKIELNEDGTRAFQARGIASESAIIEVDAPDARADKDVRVKLRMKKVKSKPKPNL